MAIFTRAARLVPVAFAAAGISFGTILLTAPAGNADPGQINASCDLTAVQCQINGQQIGLPGFPSQKDEPAPPPPPSDPGPRVHTLPPEAITEPVQVQPNPGPDPNAPGTPPPTVSGNGEGGVTVYCKPRDHREPVVRAGWGSDCGDGPPPTVPGDGTGGVTVGGECHQIIRDHRPGHEREYNAPPC
jgi:hypothetical protein